MVNNSTIKAAWITRLKANARITALVYASEIREVKWKGTDFIYPNIRVAMGNLVPTTNSNSCTVFSSEVSILIYTEQKSSKEADDIAGVVAEEFWGKQFTENNIRFSGIRLISVEPATVPQEDTNSWRSAVNFSTTVS